jgi:zinc transporter, ZIP family
VENLGPSLAWGLVVGASLVAGAVAAAVISLPARTAALLTAFGGGVLMAAIAFELMPEADREAGVALTVAGVLAGALVYVTADARLSRDAEMDRMRRSGHAAAAGRAMMMRNADEARGESIAVGLFVDGVPESIALGLTIAEGEVGVALLAGVLIGNVVEAYGAAQPIVAGGRTRRFAITLMALIGAALALATVAGGTALADASGELVGTLQAVAAGAVLAVISIAIVPHAFEQVSRMVAVATVLGFLLGYVLS